jgi:hypothetical protein
VLVLAKIAGETEETHANAVRKGAEHIPHEEVTELDRVKAGEE